MGEYRKLWWALIAVLGVTFCVLGWFGREVYRQAPPIPAQVVSADGATLFTAEDILDGQTAWQSVGGMQLGSAGHDVHGQGMGQHLFLQLQLALELPIHLRPLRPIESPQRLTEVGLGQLQAGIAMPTHGRASPGRQVIAESGTCSRRSANSTS